MKEKGQSGISFISLKIQALKPGESVTFPRDVDSLTRVSNQINYITRTKHKGVRKLHMRQDSRGEHIIVTRDGDK